MSLFFCQTTFNIWTSFCITVDTSPKYKKQQRTVTSYSITMSPSPLANRAKYTVTYNETFSRLHKGSIHNITCWSCTCAPLIATHCPYLVSSFTASVLSKQHLPPFFWLEPLFSSFIFSSCSLYIFMTRMCTIQQLLLDSSSSLSIYIRLIILNDPYKACTYVMVLYWTRSHSFIGSLAVGLLSF